MSARVTPLLLTLSLVCSLFVANIRLHAQSTAVQIDALAIVGTTLTITGKNFGASPAVQVGNANAVVSRVSETEVVAETPALSSGMYIVKVIRDSGEGGTAVSTLRVQ